jgi:hypothetical protein
MLDGHVLDGTAQDGVATFALVRHEPRSRHARSGTAR